MRGYIKSISIQYGDNIPGREPHEDLNKGMGGEYVYIVPEYTTNRYEAASKFAVEVTRNYDLYAADVSRGDGKEYFRYLCTAYACDTPEAITRVWLSRKKDTVEGDGRTTDINWSRGGDYLYLCWEFKKTDYFSYKVTNSENLPRKVRLRDITFSQTGTGVVFEGLSAFEDSRPQIQKLLENGEEARKHAIFQEFGPLPVVSIRRHPKGDTSDHTPDTLVSLDNRHLHIMRATLPAETFVSVRYEQKDSQLIEEYWVKAPQYSQGA
ncbi:uncharacterized protein LTHEOB_601 [Lasiodiplodia theobromae]|uniref:uncharacterized protein n=1 Tax=Lasiodiplodia theobromae TaxID=45133 RepID=UPI0015C2F179|nr:uncharacterized protein LTHEOB_601 [Lasiodiplodia theobromae]KAF4540659.1 hypothetical protein LTHEOB_601 [Lasiodiplodia theobromae]